MRGKSGSSLAFRRGFTLFLVIVMVAVIGAVVTASFYSSSLEASRSSLLRDRVKAYHAAVSAVKVAVSVLNQDRNGFDGVGDDWSKPFVYSYRGIGIGASISDECGKVNVNSITKPVNFKLLLRLLENLNLDSSIAYSLKDWIDRDDEVTESGAESFYYGQFGYRPSNRPFRSIYEIEYVKGIDRKTFNTLKDYLTIYGSGKVNVNSASKEVLLSLDPEMTETAVESIVEARPIRRLEEIKELPGMTEELFYRIRPLLTVRCNYFLVNSFGTFGDSHVEVEAFTDRRRVLEWKVKW